MDDLKHLREVLTEAYLREELSLDALARVLVALEGLPSAALDGGWTFKGFTDEVRKLRADRDRLRSELERSARGESICLKCGLRQDGYDAAGHAAAYPGF